MGHSLSSFFNFGRCVKQCKIVWRPTSKKEFFLLKEMNATLDQILLCKSSSAFSNGKFPAFCSKGSQNRSDVTVCLITIFWQCWEFEKNFFVSMGQKELFVVSHWQISKMSQKHWNTTKFIFLVSYWIICKFLQKCVLFTVQLKFLLTNTKITHSIFVFLVHFSCSRNPWNEIFVILMNNNNHSFFLGSL